MNKIFWSNKKIFLTGHTGFKGSWLSLWLHTLGAKVSGYALAPDTDPNLFDLIQLNHLIDSEINNICDYSFLFNSIKKAKPEIVFHLAAQPLVRESYLTPIETFKTNILGTAHVLEAIRHIPSVKVVLIITTDKCYENNKSAAYQENDRLGGHDPYSASKACAELVSSCYRDSFFDTQKIGVATARAGNVIGGGDFSSDRLIPDFIRAIQNDQAILLRNPQATRPWQHVLESLHGYLLLAEKLWHEPALFSQAWNFGPNHQDTKTVAEIVDIFIQQFGKGSWESDAGDHPHEAQALSLNIEKAQTQLKWQPKMNIQQALTMTRDWYQAWTQKQDMLQFSLNQIHAFSNG